MIPRHSPLGQLFAPLLSLMTLGALAPAQAADLYVLPTDGRPLPDHVAPLTLGSQPAPKYKACDLLYEGKIQNGDLEQFRTLFGYQDDPDYGETYEGFSDNAVLCLSSPGGDLNEALDIVDFLETMDSGLETRVLNGDTCASACTMLFLAGSYYFEGETLDRTLNRSIEPNARLGFHAPRIVLGDDGPFEKSRVEGSYARAVGTAARVFAFSHRQDTAGQTIMHPYLFTRMLETAPRDLYSITTVGDALLGQIPVTGISVQATLDAQLIETICHNAFILDDGLFDWAFGPSWKRHPLPEIIRDFNDLVAPSPSDDQPRFSTEILIEARDGVIYGVAKGYPGGGFYYAQDCLVRFDSYDDTGDTVTLAHLRDTWDAGRDVQPFQIMVADQPPQSDFSAPAPEHTKSPAAYWQYEAQDEEARRHSYPWLMAYSVATPLRDLPALAPREPSPPRTASVPIQTQAPAPKPAAKPQATCDSLWFQRNLIFHRNGYCFGGKRGQEVFGNDGCHTKSPTLSADETTQMNQIKAAEKQLGCR